MTLCSECLCSEGLLEMSYFENLFLNCEVVKGADAVFYYSYSSEVVQIILNDGAYMHIRCLRVPPRSLQVKKLFD